MLETNKVEGVLSFRMDKKDFIDTEGKIISGCICVDKKNSAEPYVIYLETEQGQQIDIAFIHSDTNIVKHTFNQIKDMLTSQDKPKLPTEADVQAIRDNILGAIAM